MKGLEEKTGKTLTHIVKEYINSAKVAKHLIRNRFGAIEQIITKKSNYYSYDKNANVEYKEEYPGSNLSLAYDITLATWIKERLCMSQRIKAFCKLAYVNPPFLGQVKTRQNSRFSIIAFQ